MPQRQPRPLTTACRVAATFRVLILSPICNTAHAEPQSASDASSHLLDLLIVVAPLVPMLAGAGLFMLTRSRLKAAGLAALGFGAWGAWEFSRTSPDDPVSGALFGLTTSGIASGLFALAGASYAHLIGAEARRLGKERTAIAHIVGLAFAALAFGLLLVTHGSDKVGLGLYVALLALSLGLSGVTGSFGGVVATMAFALLAMVHGVWGAALLSGVHDAGQAYLVIVCVPPALVPVVAAAAVGRWAGNGLRADESNERPA